MTKILLFACHLVVLLKVNSIHLNPKIKAVAVFRSDESEFHRYSAVLAATEPFRLVCEEEIKKSMSPITYWFHQLKGTVIKDPSSNVRIENKRVDIACTRFERKVDEIARIAADLEINTRLTMPTLPAICSGDSDIGKSSSQSSKAIRADNLGDSKFTRFCKAIRNVETERVNRLKSLQIELEVPRLPENMCDPEMLPALCPRIRTACEEFPHVAAVIIHQHGLEMDEFRLLRDKLENNMFFRRRVLSEIKRVEKS